MRNRSFLLITCIFASFIKAQIPSLLPSSTAIAETSVADSENWSAFHNPAALSEIVSLQLSTQFENRYIITELSTKCFSIAYPSNYFVSGLSFSHFGFSLYHEIMVGVAFARTFSEKFSIGVQFNYFTTYFHSTDSYYGAVFPQIGFNFPLSRSFQLGFHVFNPFQTNLNSEYSTKRLPSIFSLGFSYHFSENFLCRFQGDKEISSNYRIAAAFDYYLTDEIRFQAGVYGNDFLVPCLGFGYQKNQFTIDLNTELHPLLGLITLARLKFSFPVN